MLKIEKLKKFKNNFPILVGNNVVPNHPVSYTHLRAHETG